MTSNYNTTNNENTAKNAAFVALCEYVDGLGCLSSSLSDLVSLDDFETVGDFDSLDEKITYSRNPFAEDVIYYSRAMNFLLEHDSSLHRSLELADEYGYTPGNLSSEILASLLAEDINRETWNDHRDDIDALILDIIDPENDNETEND